MEKIKIEDCDCEEIPTVYCCKCKTVYTINDDGVRQTLGVLNE